MIAPFCGLWPANVMSATTLLMSMSRPQALSKFVQRRLAGTFAQHLRHLIVLLIEVSVRVEERQQFAAAQNKLVNGVLRGVGDVARMEHDQHALMSSSILVAVIGISRTVKSFFNSLTNVHGSCGRLPHAAASSGSAAEPKTGSALMSQSSAASD